MKPKDDQKQHSAEREFHRMKLFVETYVKTLHLNRVDPRIEAIKAVDVFDQKFPPKKVA